MSDDECSEEEEDFLEHPNYKNDEPTEVRMLPYIFKVDRIDPITMTCFIHAVLSVTEFIHHDFCIHFRRWHFDGPTTESSRHIRLNCVQALAFR